MTTSTEFGRSPTHEEVGTSTTKLLTKHRADNHSDELEANLLSVEVILWSKDLCDFHSKEHGGEVEDNALCDCWEENVRVGEHADLGPEVARCEGEEANLAEIEGGALEWRF